jgi:hypothetical protein
MSSFDDLRICAIRRKILVTGPNVRHVKVRKDRRKDGLMEGWKVKVKVTLGQAMITQREGRGIALLFL